MASCELLLGLTLPGGQVFHYLLLADADLGEMLQEFLHIGEREERTPVTEERGRKKSGG